MVELDFSWFDELKAKKAQQEAQERTEAEQGINTPSPAENPAESATEPHRAEINGLETSLGTLRHEANKVQSEKRIKTEIQQEAQQRKREAEQLEIEIIKGTQTGEPIEKLFLKAVKELSLITGNTMLYTQIEQDLTGVYGAALHEPEPLDLAIAATKSRLNRLIAAEQEETDPQARERQRNAIQAHRERIAHLQEQRKRM